MEDVSRGTRIQSDSRRDLYWFPTIKLSRGKLASVVEAKLLSFVSASYFALDVDYICHQQHVFVFSQCEKAIQNLVLNQENIEIVDLRLVSKRNESVNIRNIEELHGWCCSFDAIVVGGVTGANMGLLRRFIQ